MRRMKKSLISRSILLTMSVLMVLVSLSGCATSGSNTAESIQESTALADDAAGEGTTVSSESENNADKLEENTAESQTDQSAMQSSSAVSTDNSSEESSVSSDASSNASSAFSSAAVQGSSSNTVEVKNEEEIGETDEVDDLTPTQKNSINMLNYLTVLAQEISTSKGNQIDLENSYRILENNIFPNAVDTGTQTRLNDMLDTINDYRMISVKRERIEYIHEQNRAHAMRQAIPNPIGLLSAVQSGDIIKAAASVLYMTVDSVTSYNAATSQADMQFLKDGWELDDAETAALHKDTKGQLNYLYDQVRKYDLPGDYTLNKASIEEFVEWTQKTSLVRRLEWLESNEERFIKFGPYWLELAKNYYESDDYEKCLNSISQYEKVSSRIFRKDYELANVLPMAIVSAKETMNKKDYEKYAKKYCDIILDNSDMSNWSLRYFVAQIEMDLFAITKNKSYLDAAYNITVDNVNDLVDKQREMNKSYLANVEEKKAEKDASKREKNEIKQYNKALKEERKVALPPVSEALYLNCDLLFDLANECDISDSEKKRIESILHEGTEPLFLTSTLDDRFWFSKENEAVDVESLNLSYSETEISVSANCITDRSEIEVTITGSDGSNVYTEWIVKEVKRSKDNDVSGFLVTYKNDDLKKYKYQSDDVVTVKIIPVVESPDEYFEVVYDVRATKKLGVFNGISFERRTK